MFGEKKKVSINMPRWPLSFHFVSNQEAKEQLSPLSAALEKLQQEKQELVERKRQRQEEGQEKVDTFSLLSFFHCTLSLYWELSAHSATNCFTHTGLDMVDCILLSLLSVSSFGVPNSIFAWTGTGKDGPSWSFPFLFPYILTGLDIFNNETFIFNSQSALF